MGKKRKFKSMKMLEEIKYCNKGYVFEQYSRIIENFKDYEKITKTKMLKSIYDIYKEPKNIIDLCSTRELNYLKMVSSNNFEYNNKKYDWEKSLLLKKFIIDIDFEKDKLVIPEEIESYVNIALDSFNPEETKKKDQINEILVSYCKIQGTCIVDTLINFGAVLLKFDPEIIKKHIFFNRQFKYYVSIILENLEDIGEVPLAVFNDYYYLIDEICQQRKLQDKAFNAKLDLKDYKSLFYNHFNMNNATIKKFYQELMSLPCYHDQIIELIKEKVLLNANRDSLKKVITNIYSLRDYDLTSFFILMDKAMDEMASGALNGLSLNELKKIQKEEIEIRYKKEKKYIKQQNACLNNKDVKLFYKIYFALLDFTNNKYNIKHNFKIYKQQGLNPNNLTEIVDKFWEQKTIIIKEFCMINPFKFNKEELKITGEFKKGIRDIFIIAEYQEEYTSMYKDGKAYMIKGLTCNMDEIIPYYNLPYMVLTSLIPFKDKLVYDGILQSYNISFGIGFEKIANKEYENAIKYYHL